MVHDLKDKVVLITGAAGGVGAGVVRNLMEENVKHVAVLDIDDSSGIALQDELNSKYGAGKVKFHHCDVTDEDQFLGIMTTVKEEHDYLDLVINNAGLMNDSMKVYKKEILVNVLALVTGTLKALSLMRKDEGGKGGAIINIASTVALTQAPVLPIYFATKSAVLQFSNCIGMDAYYQRTGVRVMVVCFGATDTALLSRQKMGAFDPLIDAGMADVSKFVKAQKMESAAKAVIDTYKQGESGSTWLSYKDEPAKDITPEVKQAYKILTDVSYEDIPPPILPS